MDLLWQEESNKNSIFCCCFTSAPTIDTGSGLLYTDIFKTIKSNYPNLSKRNRLSGSQYERGLVKNNEKATKLREEGNIRFETGDLIEAMKYYNLSLRFAEVNSETVAFAYANRSSCFLHLKMYEKCLVDIELAKLANYPEQSLPKLEKRHADCLEAMKANDQVDDFIPQLSYDADENFPGMSNVLEIKYNVQFGRHIVAKCDIEVGKTVLLEESFTSQESASLQSEAWNCEYCQKPLMNFIACEKCTSALFCNTSCMERDEFHKIVCEEQTHKKIDNIKCDLLVMFFAINTFSNVDDLMEFVDKTIKDESTKIPKSLNDDKSKYRAFLQLNQLALADKEKLVVGSYLVYTNLMARDVIKTKFDTEKKQNFLMHLTLHHRCIILSSSFISLDPLSKPIANVVSYFNHSCAPNALCVNYLSQGNRLITVRPIQKGEQLFINYVPVARRCSPEYTTTDSRRKFLNETFAFKCECEKCESTSWPKQSDRFASDPRYAFYLKEIRDFIFQRDPRKGLSHRKDALKLQEKCIELLKEYGREEWSNEAEIVAANFYALMMIQKLVVIDDLSQGIIDDLSQF